MIKRRFAVFGHMTHMVCSSQNTICIDKYFFFCARGKYRYIFFKFYRLFFFHNLHGQMTLVFFFSLSIWGFYGVTVNGFLADRGDLLYKLEKWHESKRRSEDHSRIQRRFLLRRRQLIRQRGVFVGVLTFLRRALPGRERP